MVWPSLIIAVLSFTTPAAAQSEKVTVSVARLPLPAGKKLTWDDLTTVELPAGLVAPTAVVKGTDLVGRILAHPVAQQSLIVGQRLEGWTPPVVDEPEAPSTLAVDWELGPMAALVQAGDEVMWVRSGPQACRVARGEVVERGSPTTFTLPAADAQRLQALPSSVPMLRGAGASESGLPSCAEAP